MINKIILMGRLTADPELKQTQSGIAVVRFTVAVNRPKQKDKEQEADFINVTAWRGTAEFVSKYFSKGRMIIVEGSLHNNNYTDQNGVKHYAMDILAENVNFGESKNSSNNSNAPQMPYNAPTNVQQPMSSNGYTPYPQQPSQPPQTANMGGVENFVNAYGGNPMGTPF